MRVSLSGTTKQSETELTSDAQFPQHPFERIIYGLRAKKLPEGPTGEPPADRPQGRWVLWVQDSRYPRLRVNAHPAQSACFQKTR